MFGIHQIIRSSDIFHFMPHGLYRICNGIHNPGLGKSFSPDHTTIASPTSLVPHRIVTTMSQMKRDMQFDPSLDDFCFCQHQQGGFYMEGAPFRAGFHRGFKRANEFRPAVWIAGLNSFARLKPR